jgi:hypothetical protein
VAILALSSWGYGYSTRPVPAPGAVIEPAPSGAPVLSFLGLIGLLLLIGFFVLLATGWRFGLEMRPLW